MDTFELRYIMHGPRIIKLELNQYGTGTKIQNTLPFVPYSIKRLMYELYLVNPHSPKENK